MKSEKITEGFMEKLDQNNFKAKEILKGIIFLQDEQNEDVNQNVLAEIALEYLEKNNKLIDGIL